jgi:hypothetical protein
MKDKGEYHSVEFSVKGLPIAYQFLFVKTLLFCLA